MQDNESEDNAQNTGEEDLTQKLEEIFNSSGLSYEALLELVMKAHNVEKADNLPPDVQEQLLNFMPPPGNSVRRSGR